MTNILNEIKQERIRQDEMWGGPDHDDEHHMHSFIRWITNYANWAGQRFESEDYAETRKRLVQTAALAVAAIELLDRDKG